MGVSRDTGKRTVAVKARSQIATKRRSRSPELRPSAVCARVLMLDRHRSHIGKEEFGTTKSVSWVPSAELDRHMRWVAPRDLARAGHTVGTPTWEDL